MTSSVLAELLAYTQAHAGRHSARLNEFIPAYFDNADPGEITARGPQTLYAIATAHWRLLEAAHFVEEAAEHGQVGADAASEVGDVRRVARRGLQLGRHHLVARAEQSVEDFIRPLWRDAIPVRGIGSPRLAALGSH